MLHSPRTPVSTPRPRPCPACAPRCAGSQSSHPRGGPTAPPSSPAPGTHNLRASGGGRGALGRSGEALAAAGPQSGLGGRRGAGPGRAGPGDSDSSGCCSARRAAPAPSRSTKLRASPPPSARLCTPEPRPLPETAGCGGSAGSPAEVGTGLSPSGVSAPLASVLLEWLEWRRFSISALSAEPAAPAQTPSGPTARRRERPCRPHPEAGVLGMGRGLAGFTRPPARRRGPRLQGMQFRGHELLSKS